MFGSCVWMVSVALYVCLAACVSPQKLVPWMLAVASVIFAAKKTYSTMIATRDAITQRLEAHQKAEDDAHAVHDAVQDVLLEAGFNEVQIVLITVATCVALAVFLVFILLGCSLFMDGKSIVPTLVSSFLVLGSTFAALKSGNVPAGAVGLNKYTAALDKTQAKAENVAKKVQSVTDKVAKAQGAVGKAGKAVADASPAAPAGSSDTPVEAVGADAAAAGTTEQAPAAPATAPAKDATEGD